MSAENSGMKMSGMGSALSTAKAPHIHKTDTPTNNLPIQDVPFTVYPDFCAFSWRLNLTITYHREFAHWPNCLRDNTNAMIDCRCIPWH